MNGIKSVSKLKEELDSGRYKPSPTKTFYVMSAKRREVMGVTFKDRVYQRSLCDNAVYPAVAKGLIYDNCACQKGKGTDFARRRLTCHLQRFHRKHGLDGWVLQCDIKGYYPNMRHDIVEQAFKKRLPADVFHAVAEILRSQYEGDVGFYPGSQLIQIAGIMVLDDLDHFIKERLGIKYYIRYMDDFILIHHDLAFLQDCLTIIGSKLKEIGFELHPDKTHIVKIGTPIKFLGFYHLLTNTGCVIHIIDSRNVKRMRRKLRRLTALMKKERIGKDDVRQALTCWLAHATKGNTYHARLRMLMFYNSLQ